MELECRFWGERKTVVPEKNPWRTNYKLHPQDTKATCKSPSCSPRLHFAVGFLALTSHSCSGTSEPRPKIGLFITEYISAFANTMYIYIKSILHTLMVKGCGGFVTGCEDGSLTEALVTAWFSGTKSVWKHKQLHDTKIESKKFCYCQFDNIN